MDLSTNVGMELLSDLIICPDPLTVARLASDLMSYKQKLDGRASVHCRNERGRARHWICRWRRFDPESGRTVHRAIKLSSEQRARALQLVLAQWQAERQAERDAKRMEEQTRRQERQVLRGLRDDRLDPELLGPRAVRRGRKAFREAAEQGLWGLGTYVLANPRGYIGQPGRPGAMIRLKKRLLNKRAVFPTGWRGTGNGIRYGL